MKGSCNIVCSLSVLQSDAMLTDIGPVSKALGSALGADPSVIAIFAEEAIRGTPSAPLAQAIQTLEPMLRRMANLGDWQASTIFEQW